MKDKIYEYIKENQDNSLCDYIEIRDTLKLSDEDMHKGLSVLIEEGKVKPNIGGYTLV